MTTFDPATSTVAASLRRLYFVRFGFAILWAVALALAAATLNGVSIALLVLYPVFDLGAAIWDFRSSRAAKPAPTLYVNMALSLLTAVGLGTAVSSGAPAVLVIWGAWAISAGAVQLILGILRRRMGGQVFMMVSGGISVLAGAGFVSQGLHAGTAVSSLAGYAVLGGIFFLLSAIRLGRAAKGTKTATSAEGALR